MTRTFRSWLPSVALALAAAATVGAVLVGPATAAHAADPAAPAAGPPPVAHMVMLPHLTALQPNYFYCGPAATRIALSAHGDLPSYDQLAAELGTTTSGTQSAFEVTRVLNAHFGAGRYKTVEIPGQRATDAQIAALQNDVVTTLSRGDAVVANIVGTITDTAGDVHSYPGGHYLTVIAYSSVGGVVRVADPADGEGIPEYEMSVRTLAHWIASRGYSA